MEVVELIYVRNARYTATVSNFDMRALPSLRSFLAANYAHHYSTVHEISIESDG